MSKCQMVPCYGGSEKQDCKSVNLKIPMTVNSFDAKKTILCAACRKAFKGQWRYTKNGFVV